MSLILCFLTAMMTLARSASVKMYDVGINREVTFALQQNRHTLVITRYFTDDEMRRKRREARPAQFVAPFVSQAVTFVATKEWVSLKAELMDGAVKLQTGLPLDRSPFFKLEDDLHILLDEDNGCVHVRKYWWSSDDDELKPHKRGVTITAEEFANLLVFIDDLYEDMVPDQDAEKKKKKGRRTHNNY